MNDIVVFFYMALGVLISIVLPILAGFVREFIRSDIERHSLSGRFKKLWRSTRNYVTIGLFSFVTAGVLFAFYRASLLPGQAGLIDNWAKAFLYGYAYDSTIQKLTSGTNVLSVATSTDSKTNPTS